METQGMNDGEMQKLDTLTRELSAFESFEALINAPNYRPTIIIRDRRYMVLALAYDAAQAARGDKRRAFTAHSMPQAGDLIRFYRLGAQRVGRIDRVGPKRVRVSYVTKREAAAAKKRGHTPARFSCFLPITLLEPFSVADERGWRAGEN
jgi:hypothetical protein